MTLTALVIEAARRSPAAPAVVSAEGTTSYRDLDGTSNRIAHTLAALGVGAGARVAIYAPKGSRVIAAMQAVLRLGAAYVPIDPRNPPERARSILADCGVAAVVSAGALARQLGKSLGGVPMLALDDSVADRRWSDVLAASTTAVDQSAGEDGMAFILYTSGSTGRPKGVCISHRNALSFVAWAAGLIGAGATDRFANHASFNFDLSVFDLYCAFLRGGAVAIVPEDAAYSGPALVEFLRAQRITVWYSVPSVLMLMMDYGGLLEADLPDLRCIVFAGEVFPAKHLRRLKARFTRPLLLNFYGPTETNVCTYYEVGDLWDDQVRPVPIGAAASGNTVWAVKEEGVRAGEGELGELLVDGPTVMLGYWGQPAQAGRPYATGDIVRVLPGQMFDFIGRRDSMVKVRGHRIELGEIEAVLRSHPGVRDAALVVNGTGSEARIECFLEAEAGADPSLIELKRHCAAFLPPYMTISRCYRVERLPRTPNGKVDRAVLRQAASGAGG
jgi:amino acid adenylation domain-containing protein